MTPDEIRHIEWNRLTAEWSQFLVIRELAAQAAEFNGNFRMVNGIQASVEEPQHGNK